MMMAAVLWCKKYMMKPHYKLLLKLFLPMAKNMHLLKNAFKAWSSPLALLAMKVQKRFLLLKQYVLPIYYPLKRNFYLALVKIKHLHHYQKRHYYLYKTSSKKYLKLSMAKDMHASIAFIKMQHKVKR